MILLHILTSDYNQAIEISNDLLNQKLVINTVLLEKAITRFRSEGEGQKVKEEKQILIMAKSKALLFNQIDEQLRAKYPNSMPVLYSIPIINMDWEQVDYLVKNTVVI